MGDRLASRGWAPTEVDLGLASREAMNSVGPPVRKPQPASTSNREG